MKFRTEVDIKASGKKIEVEDKIFSIGSCFASEMSDLFSQGQLQTVNNPFQSAIRSKGFMTRNFIPKKN